ncbi:MAG: MFS transporter, partial [Proteobacteria bacterium]|nr:MFS transporter [Pseudomonadota bacterium]
SRGVGALSFGLYGGALADRFDRRLLMLVTQALLMLLTVGIAALMILDIDSTLGFVLFFTMTFLSSALLAVDIPTRLAIIPDLLPREDLGAGMSLNQLAGQLSMPLALFGIGPIILLFGFGGAYLVSSLGHLVIIICVTLMHYRATTQSAETSRYTLRRSFADIVVGLRYARKDPVIFWVVILLVILMSLAFPTTANLGPTWITTVVGVKVENAGYVMMLWGLGATGAGIALTWFSSFERRGLLIGGGALLFATSFLIFSIHPSLLNVAIGNVGIGAGMTITSVSSSILIQYLVSDEVRGRIMSIFQLNMGFAQIMTMPVALLAQWLTLEVVFPSLAILALLLVCLVLVMQPQILRATTTLKDGSS